MCSLRENGGNVRRGLHLELNRDRDYPRFSTAYFRRRWRWRALLTNEGATKPFGIYEGDAAFGITAFLVSHLPRRFGKRVGPQP